MKCLILAIHAGVLVVLCLPTTGCSSSQGQLDPVEQFSFSQADMRAAVAGNWTGPIGSTDAGYTDDIATLVLDDSASYLDQADAGSSSGTQSISPRRLQGCGAGDRQFLAGCLTESTMALAGNISSSGGTIPTSTVAGTFVVDGTTLVYGNLNVATPRGDVVLAVFSAGQFGNWTYTPLGSPTWYILDLTRQ